MKTLRRAGEIMIITAASAFGFGLGVLGLFLAALTADWLGERVRRRRP